jgi:tetratricopeptide (TPR) repeat protein
MGQLFEQGRYAEAIPLAEQARDWALRHRGENHPDYATSLHNLAALYGAKGDHTAALPLFQRALEIRGAALGDAHPDCAPTLISDCAATLINLANLYRLMGNFNAALSLCQRSLDIRRAAQGEDDPDYQRNLEDLAELGVEICRAKFPIPGAHPDDATHLTTIAEKQPETYAKSLTALGNMKGKRGDHEAALPLLSEALEVRRAALGATHPDYATSLDNLAGLHKARGDFAAEEMCCQRALEARRAALGPGHPKLADSLVRLAEIYESTGRPEEARSLYRQAIESIRPDAAGPHPDLTDWLGVLGKLESELGDFAAAEPLHQQAVEVARTTFGENHPKFATALNDLAVLYGKRGDPGAAEPLFRRALEIYRTTAGGRHPWLATCLYNFGQLHRNTGNDAAAEPLLRQAVEVFRDEPGELGAPGRVDLKLGLKDATCLASCLHSLGLLYQRRGADSAAEPLLRQAVEVARKLRGDRNPSVGIFLSDLARLHGERGDDAAAESTFRQALEACRAARGEVHPDVVTCLSHLGVLAMNRGDPVAAEPLLREAMEIGRAAFGEADPRFATSLENLADLYELRGEYPAAAATLRQLLDLKRAAQGDDDPYFIVSDLSVRLSQLYGKGGDFAAAEVLLQQVLEAHHATDGGAGPALYGVLHGLAELETQRGDYRAAEASYRQALEAKRAEYGERHPLVAISLGGLGALYVETGNYAAAGPLLRQAHEVFRAALSEQPPLKEIRLTGEDAPDSDQQPPIVCDAPPLYYHRQFAVSLHNLASWHREQGDYAAAEVLLREALEFKRTHLGQRHPDLAFTLKDLAGIYQRMGDDAAAEPLLRQALELTGATIGLRHPLYAASLSQLGTLLSRRGDLAAGESYYRQALTVTRTTVGENHPNFASGLSNLAVLHQRRGDLAAAEPLLRQALEITRAALGEHHPDFATTLMNLASLRAERGDHAAAEPLLRQALEVVRTAQGEDHPELALVLIHLAQLLLADDRDTEAWPLLIQAAGIQDRMVGAFFALGAEEQRVAYLREHSLSYHLILSLAVRRPGAAGMDAGTVLDIVLRRKAVLAEVLAVQRDAVLGGKYPDLRPQLQELAILRYQIARKALAGPEREGLEVYRETLARWEDDRRRLEVELARRIPEMDLGPRLRAADRRAVAAGLPDHSALVEFVRFHPFGFGAVGGGHRAAWGPARYLAFTLCAGRPDDVGLFDLGEAEPIDRLTAEFRAGILAAAGERPRRDLIRSRPAAAGQDPGPSLCAAVFDPLARALGGRTRLLLAPDGDLARLAFEVLPGDDGRLLIEDYQISYLSCGRDVLRFGAGATGRPGEPLVVADPDFDLEAMDTTGTRPARSGFWSRMFGRREGVIKTPIPSPPSRENIASSAGRHSRDLDRDRRACHFHRLPGTRAEGERVAAVVGASAWVGAAALEGRLKTACRSPQILHLATHGFFLPDQPRDLIRERLGLGFDLGKSFGPEEGLGRLSGPMMENPMLRSGLALAGANTWFKAGNLPEGV